MFNLALRSKPTAVQYFVAHFVCRAGKIFMLSKEDSQLSQRYATERQRVDEQKFQISCDAYRIKPGSMGNSILR